jgi:hypothetical protein
MSIPRTHLLLNAYTHRRRLRSRGDIRLATLALRATALAILFPLNIPSSILIHTNPRSLADRTALQIEIEIHVGVRVAGAAVVA